MNWFAKNSINRVLAEYTSGNVNGRGYQVPAEETPLCKLAYKYGTDKCEKIKHPFTHFYYDLVNPQSRAFRKVLQIGIEMKRHPPFNTTGASLYMWRDFLPLAQVYGADPNPRAMFSDERIKTVLCNPAKNNDLTKLIQETGSNIDLVISDSSHDPQDQLATCLIAMPLLKSDVIYIIEDVADLSLEKKLRAYDTKLISLRKSDGKRFRDDKLMVVRNAKNWA